MPEPGGGGEKELPPECPSGEHDLREVASTPVGGRDGAGGRIRNFHCDTCKRTYPEHELSPADFDEEENGDNDDENGDK